MPTNPILLVHGGAWSIPDALREAHEAGVRAALTTGYALLTQGASALDAIEAAVSTLEDDDTLRAGGVACVERIRNPIRAARLVLEQSPHVYFVARGAEAFAASKGMSLIDNSDLVIDRERAHLAEAQRKEQAGLPDLTFAGAGVPEAFLDSHDTVGAVALDTHGNLAAATSTGGTLNKTPGRVGDSSLIGCGCYADNQSAATSLTGWGEPIMKLVLGKWAADRVAAGDPPHQAAQAAIRYLHNRLEGHGGIILLGPDGRFGIAHNTPGMAWGIADATGFRTGLEAPAE
jgi:beta-aspartyl-peptidase (threonine type)